MMIHHTWKDRAVYAVALLLACGGGLCLWAAIYYLA